VHIGFSMYVFIYVYHRLYACMTLYASISVNLYSATSTPLLRLASDSGHRRIGENSSEESDLQGKPVPCRWDIHNMHAYMYSCIRMCACMCIGMYQAY